MVINKDSLAARVNNISKKYGIDANALYSRYFFDCFLSRLAKSEYVDLFILKGGLYLSLIFGIENRVTKDMDFSLRKIKMDRDTVADVIKTICEQSSDDAVHFCYLGESPIKKDDVYGGFSVVLEGKLGNVKQRFEIDLGAGDCIYPRECECDYECIITKEHLRIKSYSVESVLAEKLQAFLFLGTSNSRSKDFYDLYVLEKLALFKQTTD